jgi:hypothetical protein
VALEGLPSSICDTDEHMYSTISYSTISLLKHMPPLQKYLQVLGLPRPTKVIARAVAVAMVMDMAIQKKMGLAREMSTLCWRSIKRRGTLVHLRIVALEKRCWRKMSC